MVVKDSYANCLVPFLTGHYDAIHIVDLRHFNLELDSYIAEHGLSEILFVYNALSFADDPSIHKILAYNKGPGS